MACRNATTSNRSPSRSSSSSAWRIAASESRCLRRARPVAGSPARPPPRPPRRSRRRRSRRSRGRSTPPPAQRARLWRRGDTSHTLEVLPRDLLRSAPRGDDRHRRLQALVHVVSPHRPRISRQARPTRRRAPTAVSRHSSIRPTPPRGASRRRTPAAPTPGRASAVSRSGAKYRRRSSRSRPSSSSSALARRCPRSPVASCSPPRPRGAATDPDRRRGERPCERIDDRQGMRLLFSTGVRVRSSSVAPAAPILRPNRVRTVGRAVEKVATTARASRRSARSSAARRPRSSTNARPRLSACAHGAGELRRCCGMGLEDDALRVLFRRPVDQTLLERDLLRRGHQTEGSEVLSQHEHGRRSCGGRPLRRLSRLLQRCREGLRRHRDHHRVRRGHQRTDAGHHVGVHDSFDPRRDRVRQPYPHRRVGHEAVADDGHPRLGNTERRVRAGATWGSARTARSPAGRAATLARGVAPARGGRRPRVPTRSDAGVPARRPTARHDGTGRGGSAARDPCRCRRPSPGPATR